MPLRVSAAAEADVIDATLWYEDQEVGLGLRFAARLDRALESIERSPESFPLVEETNSPRFRYCLPTPFAYRIGFRIDPDEVVVFGVAHTRRGRGFWRRRVRESGG